MTVIRSLLANLPRLTTRGAGLFVFGLVLLIGQTFTHLAVLTLLGAAILALCLLSCLLVSTPWGLDVQRRTQTVEPTVGDPFRIDVTIRRNIPIPTGKILVHAEGQNRDKWWWLNSPSRGKDRSLPDLSYECKASHRGRYLVPTLHIQRYDPLGIALRKKSYTDDLTVLALPPVRHISWNLKHRAHTFDSVTQTNAFLGDSVDETLREYREGDPLNRVHWKSSARRGRTMVRAEAQNIHRTLTLFIDDRPESYPATPLEPTAILPGGDGTPEPLFEQAVRLLTSFAVAASTHDTQLTIATVSGTIRQFSPGDISDIRRFAALLELTSSPTHHESSEAIFFTESSVLFKETETILITSESSGASNSSQHSDHREVFPGVVIGVSADPGVLSWREAGFLTAGFRVPHDTVWHEAAAAS